MTIQFKTATGEASASDARGLLLVEVAAKAGLRINTRCGGQGVCEGCRVQLGPGTYLFGDTTVTLGPGEHREALACQMRVKGDDARITVPSSSLLEQDVYIEEDFAPVPVVCDPPSLKVCLQVPPPTLDEPTPDAERVEAALLALGGERAFVFTPSVLRRLQDALARGQGVVTVTAEEAGDRWQVMDVEPGEATARHLGVAVDIGTTTVVAMLVDLNRGEILRRASQYNQQITRADDVASRISYCTGRARVEELQSLVVEGTINVLLREMCGEEGVDPASVCRMAVSGNTVMSHLFMGINPESIGRLPFQPVANRFGGCRGADVGVAMHPDGVIEVVPSVAGYVGGDITSDMHVAGVSKAESKLTLLVDIGTNGEMVLAEEGRLLACATAAGPAFEGAGILHGCRAAAGAIERIRLGPSLEPDCGVIGHAAPVGLCGTAILDFIAEGARAGMINQVGRFEVDLLRRRGRYAEAGHGTGAGHAFLLVDAASSGTGRPILVSERDVAEILKAKAATYAGMQTLLDVRGKTFLDVQRFVLAGGFARHIDIENAIRIGLLPDLPHERFDVIGNGSLAGAFLALVDASAMRSYEALSARPEIVELNLQKSFEPNFIDALTLP